MIHTFIRGNDLYANAQDVSYKQAVTIDGQTYQAQGLNADLTARLLAPVQPEPTHTHDFDTCQYSGDIKLLRAWGRAVAFGAEWASHKELTHALDHFKRIRDAAGHPNYLGIDATCVDMIHRELAEDAMWRRRTDNTTGAR